MGITLILLGVGCIIGAIVGGGVKLSHLEIAKFSSVWRQAILAGFGLVMLLIGVGINQDGRSAAAQSTGADGTAAGEAVVKSEDSPNADAQTAASSQPRDISGAWTDVDQNRIVFDLANGTFTLTPSGGSVAYPGKVTVAGNRLEWRVDGGGGLCRGVMESDGRSMSGTCTDAQSGEDVPIVLNRVTD